MDKHTKDMIETLNRVTEEFVKCKMPKITFCGDNGENEQAKRNNELNNAFNNGIDKCVDLIELEVVKLEHDCAHCTKTYGTLGCCDTVSNELVYSCEEGHNEFKNRKKQEGLVTFNELPVNSLFIWGNGLRFFKTKDAVSGVKMSEQEPDCISLSNLHGCVIADKAPCKLIKTFSKGDVYEAIQKLQDLFKEE